MAEMAAAAWAFVKAAFVAVGSGTATAGQVATVVAVNVAGSVALSTAASVLMKPDVGGRAPGEWLADPNAGIPFAIGDRIGVAGNIVYKNTFGKDNEYKGIVTVLSGAGPISAYLGFTADREPIAFAGEAATGRYGGEMWMQRRLGEQPDTALTSPAAITYQTLPHWGPNHRLSGKAAFMWTLRMDSKFSVYPQGEPAPISVLRGIKGYDHRYDSTMPGGSGPCRLNDRSTYRTITNPAIADLNWCLGLRENGKVVGGLGVSPAGIDWSAYTRAANVADANAWTLAAYPRSDESKSEVRAGMLQAAGAVISRRAGLVSCVTRGAPKSPVMTISAADTAGPIELDTAANVLNRYNTMTPRYLSEAHEWQLAPSAPVSSSVYVEEDRGRVRSDQRDYPYVPNAKQAAELCALDIAHSREGIAGRWPLKAYCRDLEPGDVFTVNEPGLLLDGMDMLVLDRDYDPETDTPYVVFVSETPGKVAWALGQQANPSPTPALSARHHLNAPDPGAFDVVIVPPSPEGVSAPGAEVVIDIDNARAEDLVIEIGPSFDGPWRVAKTVTINDGQLRIPVNELSPGEVFWVALSYRSADDGASPKTIKGPYTAGDLIAGGLAPESPIWGQLNDLTKQALRSAIEAAQALLDEEQRRQIEVNDILDRLGLGFLLDPVTRTALIKSETVVEGVGPGGLPETLVQMSARLVAADAANTANTAQALITAEAKINALRSESYAAFATYNAMGDAIAANALVIRGQVTAEIASATANLVSSTQMGTAISNSEVSLRNWTNGRISESVTGLASTAYVAGSLATAKGQWEAYADDAAARSIVGLDSVAAREAALGAAVLSLQAWSDGRFATSSALLAVQSTANNASSTAALALNAANGNEAYAALTVDAGNRLTAMRINGVTRAIDFLAETFNVTAEGGNGISYSAASKVFKIFGEGQKTLMKASGGVRFWSGPTSVPDGSETAENGVIALGPGVPGGGQFNGLTLSRPFDTGVGSDTAIVIQPDTWTVIAETSLHYMRDGVFMTAASIEALVSSSTADGSVSWVVESVNAAGGDPVIVAQGGFLLPANIIPWTTGRSAYLPGLGRRTGERRLRLSIAWSNPPVTGVTIRKARLWGLYAAELTSWPN